MQPGIRRDSEGLTGLNGVGRQRPANGSSDPDDERNLDYCSSHLNPLTSHHSESGQSTLLQNWTRNIPPNLPSPPVQACWEAKTFGLRFLWARLTHRSWFSFWNLTLRSDLVFHTLDVKHYHSRPLIHLNAFSSQMMVLTGLDIN